MACYYRFERFEFVVFQLKHYEIRNHKQNA